MAEPSVPASTSVAAPLPAPLPDKVSLYEVRVRKLAILLLRVGLGMHLLNLGLSSYVLRSGALANSNVQLLPYLQVALGVALILGVFTTAAAVGAGFLVLLQPLAQTLIMLAGGLNPAVRPPLSVRMLYEAGGGTGNLLIAAVVLWFSPPGRNAWSIDGLIFTPETARPPQERSGPPAPGSGAASGSNAGAGADAGAGPGSDLAAAANGESGMLTPRCVESPYPDSIA
jgi:hypothetical protein